MMVVILFIKTRHGTTVTIISWRGKPIPYGRPLMREREREGARREEEGGRSDSVTYSVGQYGARPISPFPEAGAGLPPARESGRHKGEPSAPSGRQDARGGCGLAAGRVRPLRERAGLPVCWRCGRSAEPADAPPPAHESMAVVFITTAQRALHCCTQKVGQAASAPETRSGQELESRSDSDRRGGLTRLERCLRLEHSLQRARRRVAFPHGLGLGLPFHRLRLPRRALLLLGSRSSRSRLSRPGTAVVFYKFRSLVP